MERRLGEVLWKALEALPYSDLSDYQDLMKVLNDGPLKENDIDVAKSKTIEAKFNLNSKDCNRRDSKD